MKLFEDYPVLYDGHITIKQMTIDDAADLSEMTRKKNVYRYLPEFLYELKYDDIYTVLDRMHEECFLTKQNLLLGIYPDSAGGRFAGIAEVYNYQEDLGKVSIGSRLKEKYWGQGIASRTVSLLKKYLADAGIKIITAHAMQENKTSEAVLKKNGFLLAEKGLAEDWGPGKQVVADKYVFKFNEQSF